MQATTVPVPVQDIGDAFKATSGWRDRLTIRSNRTRGHWWWPRLPFGLGKG
jgi:hypothetical protein